MRDRELISGAAMDSDRQYETALRPSRLADFTGQARLKENLSRVPGLDVALVQADLLENIAMVLSEHRLPEEFQAVLLDAPCSNTGVMRHRVDVKWRLQPGDFKKHPQQQLSLLHSAARLVAPGGRLIALDLLPMEPVHGVQFIQGDFHDAAVLQALTDALDGRQVDLVLSDMAPNMSGIGMVDQARVMVLAELTLEFCALHLKPGGDMLVKVFQGDGFMELRKALQMQFATLQMRKPAASRNRSAEIYLLARGRVAAQS